MCILPKKLPTVVSFCTGYAGIERGLDIAMFEHRVIAYVEIEAYAIANLVSKMERGELDAAPIWTNIKTLPLEQFRDRVDLLAGGYPCQPFSFAGNRARKDDPRHLWPHISNIIKAIRPVRCFFENVEGHINLGLREVISDLEGLGYKTAWGIFSASEVGAPHQRKRVYILGYSQHYGSSAATVGGSNETHDSETPKKQCSTVKSPRASKPENGKCCERSKSEGKLLHSCEAEPSSNTNTTKLADSCSERLQGHTKHKSNNETRQAYSIQDGHATTKSSDDRWCARWPPEPCVGRVVNGCPDRVDRIRLLGNGVVPKTAAKAWLVLNCCLTI